MTTKAHMIDIGFTGTRKGLNYEQRRKLNRAVIRFNDTYGIRRFHHGDCIGADEEAQKLVEAATAAIIHLHPPIDSRLRTFCNYHYKEPCKEYLDRNKDIVDASDVMLACPKELGSVLRSGTWSTIRYAQKKCKPILIVFVDGSIKTYNWEKLQCWLRTTQSHS